MNENGNQIPLECNPESLSLTVERTGGFGYIPEKLTVTGTDVAYTYGRGEQVPKTAKLSVEQQNQLLQLCNAVNHGAPLSTGSGNPQAADIFGYDIMFANQRFHVQDGAEAEQPAAVQSVLRFSKAINQTLRGVSNST